MKVYSTYYRVIIFGSSLPVRLAKHDYFIPNVKLLSLSISEIIWDVNKINGTIYYACGGVCDTIKWKIDRNNYLFGGLNLRTCNVYMCVCVCVCMCVEYLKLLVSSTCVKELNWAITQKRLYKSSRSCKSIKCLLWADASVCLPLEAADKISPCGAREEMEFIIARYSNK